MSTKRSPIFVPVFYTKGLNAPFTEGHIQIVRMMVKSLMLCGIKSVVLNFKYNVGEEYNQDHLINEFRIQQRIPITSRESIIFGGSRALLAYSLLMETMMMPRFLLFETALKQRDYVVNIVNCFRYPRIFVKKLFKAPVILHFYFRHTHGRRMIKLFAKKADKFIASSHDIARYLNMQGVAKEKIAVVYPPTDTEIYKPLSKNLARTELCLRQNAKIVLYIGNLKTSRFPENKVLQMVAELAKQNPEALLLIFAPNTSSNILQAQNILKKARFLGLTDKVQVYTKNLSEKEKVALYAASDVFFFPGDSRVAVEPPLTALEAMACGRTVLAPRLSALAEIITNNVNGLLFETNDPATLSNKLTNLLNDENLRHKIFKNARYTILNKASLGTSGRALFEIHEDLLKHES